MQCRGKAAETYVDYNTGFFIRKIIKKPPESEKEPYLELDNPILGQAEVHPLGILQVKSALVKLGHRIISVQTRHLFIDLKIFVDCQQGKK